MINSRKWRGGARVGRAPLQLRFSAVIGILIVGLSGARMALSQETSTYTYDALGRVTNVSRSGGPQDGTNTTYVYDPAGNRTNVHVAGASAPSFKIAGASANEGSPLTFNVTLSKATESSYTIQYATANGTALSGTNYTATSGTLTFPVGTTSASFTVQTIHDGVYTANLTMNATLSNPSGDAVLGIAGATGTIVNTDAQGASLAISPANANEGSPLSFTVTRSGNTTSAVTVNYVTANGTALAGTNYAATSGTLNFPAGVTSQTITVPTSDDHVYTANLLMAVSLSSPTAGATLATASANGTIVNIDPPAANLSILSISSATANEGSPLSFTVTRSGNTASAVTVNYATANGTALAGTNYAAASGMLNFAAGVTSQIVIVPTADDHVYTANLIMTVSLSTPSTGAALATASANGTVVNIDALHFIVLPINGYTIIPYVN